MKLKEIGEVLRNWMRKGRGCLRRGKKRELQRPDCAKKKGPRAKGVEQLGRDRSGGRENGEKSGGRGKNRKVGHVLQGIGREAKKKANRQKNQKPEKQKGGVVEVGARKVGVRIVTEGKQEKREAKKCRAESPRTGR